MKGSIHISLLLVLGLTTGCSGDHPASDPEESLVEEPSVEGHSHAPSEHPGPEELVLPDRLRDILRKEMRLIETGMAQLMGHLAQGRKDAVVEVAERIQKSFVLKQELSGEDLRLLVSLLPNEFVAQDRGFHTNAGELAAATRRGDFVSATRIYGGMAEACVTCHSLYARDRFPALAKR